MGVFLRDPSPYSHEFRKKTWKLPNGLVDKLDRGLNLAPPVFQFWALPLRRWWGPEFLECANFDSYCTQMIYIFFRLCWNSSLEGSTRLLYFLWFLNSTYLNTYLMVSTLVTFRLTGNIANLCCQLLFSTADIVYSRYFCYYNLKFNSSSFIKIWDSLN